MKNYMLQNKYTQIFTVNDFVFLLLFMSYCIVVCAPARGKKLREYQIFLFLVVIFVAVLLMDFVNILTLFTQLFFIFMLNYFFMHNILCFVFFHCVVNFYFYWIPSTYVLYLYFIQLSFYFFSHNPGIQ